MKVWGAQAGGLYSGYGGYSYGSYQTTANGVLYVVVGGQGVAQYGSYNAGGYNGGGYGSSIGRSGMDAGDGGGATHIATRTGLLSSLSSYQSPVLIVAGGGGGGGTNAASWQGYGGNGGGYQGTAGRYCTGTQCSNNNPQPVVGTQSSGYSFGLGGSATNSASNCAGGGGGGWYGGGTTTAVSCNNWGGSGGSGYIANSSLLSDKGMYMYILYPYWW